MLSIEVFLLLISFLWADSIDNPIYILKRVIEELRGAIMDYFLLSCRKKDNLVILLHLDNELKCVWPN